MRCEKINGDMLVFEHTIFINWELCSVLQRFKMNITSVWTQQVKKLRTFKKKKILFSLYDNF